MLKRSQLQLVDQTEPQLEATHMQTGMRSYRGAGHHTAKEGKAPADACTQVAAQLCNERSKGGKMVHKEKGMARKRECPDTPQ